jgi:hypothetical protein
VLPGVLIGARFEIESVAAVGGMGTVYRARDRDSGEIVALKVMRGGGDHERFIREAQVLAELRHPHIVRYIAHGEIGAGELFIAMEWLEGEDLATRMRRAPLSIKQSVLMAQNVSAALAVAHARGVVHRDLKPSNLFLPGGEAGAVKLLDFGVAYLHDAGAMTRTGSIIGTPSYMAPEQARGQRPLTARSDVFSLGAVLFQCLTGRPPFEGDGALAVMARIVLDPTPQPRVSRPELSPVLDALVARLLAKHPEDRPADGAELERELSLLSEHESLDGAPPPLAVPTGVLTTSELRVVCVLMFRLDGTQARPDLAETVKVGQPSEYDAIIASIRATVATFGGRCERLLDGTFLVTVTGAGAATDQVARAARCALALRAMLSSITIALATGRAMVEGRAAVGEAIDRAVRVLGSDASPTGILLDELSVRLASTEFDVKREGKVQVLERERSTEGVRTLLGKPSPCVGRDAELALLESRLNECIEEPAGRAALIVGPAGAGKSRLRYELRQRARTRVAEVWIARGDPLRNGSPFGLMAQLVRSAAEAAEAEPLDEQRDKLRRLVERARHNDSGVIAPESARDDERVALFLGELIGVAFDDERPELRAARADQRLMGEQIHRAFSDWITAAAKRPILIVLEDLQWGDLPSVLAIDSALRTLHDRPLFVLALGRPEVKDVFPHLWSERALQEIRLGGLSRKAAEALVRHMLGDDVGDSRVASIVEHAGGNAFFLEELIRAAAEDHTDTLPETVLAMTQLRLERFPSEVRMVLRASSIFGLSFWRDGVAELVGGAGRLSEVDGSLRLLVDREVVSRAGAGRLAGQEELRFRHGIVRDAAYATLTPDDRMLGHRMAARWLEHAGERDPLLLAEHHERGGDLPSAISWWVRAADQAFEASDLQATLRLVERGIACGAFGEALGSLRATAAEALFHAGDFSGCNEHARAAIAAAPLGSISWYRAVSQLLALTQQSFVTPLQEIVAAVSAVPPPVEPVPTHFVVWFVITSTFLIVDLPAEAAAFQRRMEEALPRAKSPMAAAWTLYGRCLAAAVRDHDPDLAFRSITEAVQICDAAGDRRALMWLTLQLANSCVVIGAFAEAEAHARRVLATAFGVGLARAMGELFLSRALTPMGRLDEAEERQRVALAAFAQQRNTMFSGYARHHGAVLQALRGDFVAAEGEASAALDEILSARHRAAVLATLAEARLGLGRLDDALASGRAAYEAARYGAVEDLRISAYLSYARALVAAGRGDEARAIVAEGHERLMESASGFTDETRQRAFLAMTDHAAIIRLHAQADAT